MSNDPQLVSTTATDPLGGGSSLRGLLRSTSFGTGSSICSQPAGSSTSGSSSSPPPQAAIRPAASTTETRHAARERIERGSVTGCDHGSDGVLRAHPTTGTCTDHGAGAKQRAGQGALAVAGAPQAGAG